MRTFQNFQNHEALRLNETSFGLNIEYKINICLMLFVLRIVVKCIGWIPYHYSITPIFQLHVNSSQFSTFHKTDIAETN